MGSFGECVDEGDDGIVVAIYAQVFVICDCSGQLRDEVDVDALPTAFRDLQWLQPTIGLLVRRLRMVASGTTAYIACKDVRNISESFGLFYTFMMEQLVML